MSLWLGILSGVTTIPAIGESAYGGYMAGIIDTTIPGSIVNTDYYQSGARYLLIVAPKSLQAVKNPWVSSSTPLPAEMNTRWNGLGATTALKNLGSTFEAATYCYDLSFPSDGGSRWYLPALDELELCYRSFKPTTQNNITGRPGANSETFPPNGTQFMGLNLSSDPSGAAYTSTVPSQTSLSAFQSGNSEAFNSDIYWTSTKYNNNNVWYQRFGDPTICGFQSGSGGSFPTRPVRRILL